MTNQLLAAAFEGIALGASIGIGVGLGAALALYLYSRTL